MDLRFAEALAVARIKARIEKTGCSAGNALRKLNMQLLASLLRRGNPFFCFGKKGWITLQVNNHFLIDFLWSHKKEKMSLQIMRVNIT